jgi:hypothetical protein
MDRMHWQINEEEMRRDQEQFLWALLTAAGGRVEISAQVMQAYTPGVSAIRVHTEIETGKLIYEAYRLDPPPAPARRNVAREVARQMKPQIDALHARATQVVNDRNNLIDQITDPAVRRSLGRE